MRYALIPMFDDDPKIIRLINEMALACPECGAATHRLRLASEAKLISPRFALICKDCNHAGPRGKDISAAVKRWNQKPGFIASWLARRQRRLRLAALNAEKLQPHSGVFA